MISVSAVTMALSGALIPNLSIIKSPAIGTILALSYSLRWGFFWNNGVNISESKIYLSNRSWRDMFFFALIITNIFLKFGKHRIIFSKTTLPTNPVHPVMKMVFPA